jgi:hypothetical protein
MYQDIKKRDVIQYVLTCLTNQKVKVEHKKPAGLLQPLLIPEWKWDKVTMVFVTGLPTSKINKELFGLQWID